MAKDVRERVQIAYAKLVEEHARHSLHDRKLGRHGTSIWQSQYSSIPTRTGLVFGWGTQPVTSEWPMSLPCPPWMPQAQGHLESLYGSIFCVISLYIICGAVARISGIKVWCGEVHTHMCHVCIYWVFNFMVSLCVPIIKADLWLL